jgi:hypothetical protein
MSSTLSLEAQSNVLGSIYIDVYATRRTRPAGIWLPASPKRLHYYIPRFAMNSSSGNADIFAYAEAKSKITKSRDILIREGFIFKIEEHVSSSVYRI